MDYLIVYVLEKDTLSKPYGVILAVLSVFLINGIDQKFVVSEI